MVKPKLLLPTFFLLLTVLACSLPGLAPSPEADRPPDENTEAPPDISLAPSPPTLIEVDPARGEEALVEGAITLYFDQEMDQSSVRDAFRIEPQVPGQINWLDGRTLSFEPDQPLQRKSIYKISIGESARSSAGLNLSQPINVQVQTVGFLEISQVIPEPLSQDVDPGSPITVVFNRPVVPLQISGVVPQPLRLEPAIQGKGEWIDTSIYIFRPETTLPGGLTITAHLEAGLSDLTGGVLPESFEWNFVTALPRIVSIEPASGISVPLDSPISVTFNQTMDQASVERAFSLIAGSGQTQSGSFQWNADDTQLTFTPSTPLEYATSYSFQIEASASSAGGSGLESPFFFNLQTVPRPAVLNTSPTPGGVKTPYSSVEIGFSAPMDQASLIQALEIFPSVENIGTFWREADDQLLVFGDFLPSTSYRLTLNQTAVDPYGTALSTIFQLPFTTDRLPPSLSYAQFGQTLSLTASGPQAIELQARNITRLDLALYQLSFDQFLDRLEFGLFGIGPIGELVRQWSLPVSSIQNQTELVRVPLQNTPLAPGAYLLFVNSPDQGIESTARLLVIRRTELVMKWTLERAQIWAVDLTEGAPIPDLEIILRHEGGGEITRGRTNAQGILDTNFPRLTQTYSRIYAQTGLPGDDLFGFTASDWSQGIDPYNFRIWLDPTQPEHKIYLYTDRPIYRPGQTVRYRGILRRTDEARYLLPDLADVEVTVRDSQGEIIHTQQAPLSDFGTFNGEFSLGPSGALGGYSISTEFGNLYFEVAAYRKPEFIVHVEPSSSEVGLGDHLSATISAEFFFGGPVTEADVEWSAWASPSYPPDLPRPIDWFGLIEGPSFPFLYDPIAEGTGRTDSSGAFEVSIPTSLSEAEPALITIEATLTDQAGFPVSGRETVRFHPAGVYYTLTPERYSLRAGDTAVVRMTATDWASVVVPNQVTDLSVERLTWRQVVDEDGLIQWASEATLVNQARVSTNLDGSLLFSFQPETGGTYRVRASGHDAEARLAEGELTVWVAGEGSNLWRQPSAGRLALVPDKERYQPGDTAKVLVPVDFEGAAQAWVSIERGEILSYQILEIDRENAILELPISDIHAPNIFLSVLLIQPPNEGQPASLSRGLVEVPVDANALSLNVSLKADRSTAAPGDEISYQLEVRDSSGNPVEAEFSLALADLAALSITEPNSRSPFEGFYSSQPLRVRTSASLAISAEVGLTGLPSDGRGGGGGDIGLFEVRSEFPDTAFWNATVLTRSDGKAEVTLTLPDNLTTWRMDARGVTTNTLVGDTTVDLIATKELLIRPVTPRFFTDGDIATVAAIVHNNSGKALSLEVELQASGASILSSASHVRTIETEGQDRFEWTLRVMDTDAVDLTFLAAGGGLRDASKPTVGSAQDGMLPVMRYTAPDTVGTAGVLTEAGDRLEVINLPRRYDATQGELQASLDPSLGSAIESALEVLDLYPYQSTEQVVSRFLPNLVAYQTMDRMGIENQALLEDLEFNLKEGIQILRTRQREDGGWGWWKASPPDAYLSAYVIFGLSLADQSGFNLAERTIEAGLQYLRAGVVPPEFLTERTDLDRQAFVLYVLAAAGSEDLATTQIMAEDHLSLSLWARSLLALTLFQLEPGLEIIPSMVSNLEAAAIQSATGAHWEDEGMDSWNMSSSVRTTAHVVQTLVAIEPDHPLLPNAVRWLMEARDREGAWASSHETAWALIALSDWLEFSGGLEAEFVFDLFLNGRALVSGAASPSAPFSSVDVHVDVAELLAHQPNQLLFRRGSGSGSLYYTAHLNIFQPVEEALNSSRGLAITREYFLYDGTCDGIEIVCQPADQAQVGDDLLVRLSLVLPSDQYYLALVDPYPAGAEPVDTQLLTSPSLTPTGITSQPLRGGWGWWRFTHREFGDQHLALFADFLPAGTYQYTYLLHATLPGEYRVLPPRAWAMYFPEVYGQGDGRVYTIQP